MGAVVQIVTVTNRTENYNKKNNIQYRPLVSTQLHTGQAIRLCTKDVK